MAAFVLTKDLALLHPYTMGSDGERSLRQPIDVHIGGDIPEGHTFSLPGGTWVPGRATDRTSKRKPGKPRSENLSSREMAEALVRSWESIWLYVRERVLGKRPGRSPLQGLDSQTVNLLVSPPETPPSALPPWFKAVTIEVGAESRGYKQALRELLAFVPASESVAEVVVVPPGKGIMSGAGWRSGPIRLRGLGPEARPSSIAPAVYREIKRLAGRKMRFDPSKGPIRLACLLLRRGHGDLPKAKIGEVAQIVYGLDRALTKGDEDSKEWRAVVRHLAGARRQIAAAGRQPTD